MLIEQKHPTPSQVFIIISILYKKYLLYFYDTTGNSLRCCRHKSEIKEEPGDNSYILQHFHLASPRRLTILGAKTAAPYGTDKKLADP